MKRKIVTLITTVLLLGATAPLSVNAAGFVQDTTGVKYQYDDGTFAVNTWVQVGNSIYRLDQNGVVQTGWIQVGALWYFLDANGICTNPWGDANPPTEVVQQNSQSQVFTDWVPYSTTDLKTLLYDMATGNVIFDGFQYWASPEYANMLANEEIVYYNDVSPDTIPHDNGSYLRNLDTSTVNWITE